MNILKNMEAIFCVALALVCSAIIVLDPPFQVETQAPAAVSTNSAPPAVMAVVHVRAKRMTPQEKLQSLNEEHEMRKVADKNPAAGNRM
jgi:hypothetical protein